MGDPIDINDLASIGVVQDQPPYQVPPEAWTTVLNMVVEDASWARAKGWASIFGTPTVAPHFALPVRSPSQSLWLYTSLTKAYVWDGSSHTNVTRQSAGVDVNYTVSETRDWNGTLFAGIPILNNGADVPQYWAALSPATKLANLTNWPGTHRAKLIRALGPFLVALNVTEGSTVYQHLVRWSQSVTAPGTLPASWDVTDQAIDANQYDLPDVDAGGIVEALRLGSRLFIYKESSTWHMRFVGGRPVHAFDTYSEKSGILAPRCVALTGDGKRHVVATQDDIIIHDGVGEPKSIVDARMRRTVFNAIDTTNFLNCFMFTDAENNNVHFCYPESGQTNPNRSLVYNYKREALSEGDGVTYRNAAAGRVEAATGETWATASGTWETDFDPWSRQDRRKVVLCGTDATKFYQLNSGLTRDGVSYASTLQRIGLSVLGKKRNGEWIVDHQIIKFIDRVWPKLRTTSGSIRCRVGHQEVVDGPVTWGDYQDFTPSSQVTVDISQSGRATAIEFSTTESKDWKADGYKILVTPDAEF